MTRLIQWWLRDGLAAMLSVCCTVLPAAIAGGAPLSIQLGPGADANWDPCPIWGQFHVQVLSGRPELTADLLATEHPSLQRVTVSGEATRLTATFDLAAGVTDIGVQLNGDAAAGRDLVLTFESSEVRGTLPLTEQLAARLAVQPTPGGVVTTSGLMPVGATSPWTLLATREAPQAHAAFVLLDENWQTTLQQTEGIADLDPLAEGLEARSHASQGGDGSWWVEAAARFQLAAAITSPGEINIPALALAGESLYHAGAMSPSAVYFDRALEAAQGTESAPWYQLGRGLAVQGMGRHDQAMDDLEAAGMALPAQDRAAPLAAMMFSLAIQERHSEALALMNALHRGWPEQAEVLIDPWFEAEVTYRAGSVEDAVRALRKLEFAEGPKRPLVLLRLADCARMSGDDTEAKLWLRALEESGSRWAIFLNRIRELEWELESQDGTDHPDIIAELRGLAGIEPAAALEIALVESAYLHRQEMLLDAVRMDRDTLRFHGDFPGRIHVEKRMCTAATTLLMMADDEGNSIRVAGLYLDFLDQRHVDECSEPEMMQRSADALESLALWDDARRVLTEMMVDERLAITERDEVTLRLARLYLISGKLEEGLRTVNYLREQGNGTHNTAELAVVEAELLLLKGDSPGARKALAPALGKRIPKATRQPALCLLAHIEIVDEDPQAAVGHLTEGTAHGDADPADLVLLGWVQHQIGRHQASLTTLERLDAESTPASTFSAAQYVRAHALRELGREEEATVMLAENPLASEPGLWSDLANHDRTELLWYAQIRELMSADPEL